MLIKNKNKTKQNKCVVLLSTTHHDKEVDRKTSKPKIILIYNSTKGAVDTIEQLCHLYIKQKETKTWPAAFFIKNSNLTGRNDFIWFMES